MNELITRKNNDRNIRFRNIGLSDLSKSAYSEGVNQYHVYIDTQGITESPESVMSWIESIKNNPDMKSSTKNLRIRGLKDYLLKKYETDLQTHYGIEQIFKGIKLVKTQTAITANEYLEYPQVKALSLKMTPIIRLITCGLFWSGCRISELINIKLSDCKIFDKVVYIEVTGKGSKQRTVNMPIDLYKDIQTQFKGKVNLFETSTGKPYSRKAIWQEINRQSKLHEFNIHCHTLRHSIAMYLKNERHLSADQICKYLGHSDVAITLRHYFHGSPTTADLGIPISGY
jgi:integrase